MRTGGQVLADCLKAQGVRRIFGVPGESYLALLDALHDHPGIELIGNRHEGGAAFMAAAHGQLTGQPGICMVTRGPGATNAAIGVHAARQASSPMILLVGQIAREMRGREAFQELDYPAVFGTMAKWAVEIDSADRIPELLARAFATAMSGRPGPVVISLPEDMLTDQTSASATPRVRLSESAPGTEEILALRKMFARAERPLIIAGGGGWTEAGRADFRRFVETAELPVAAAFRYGHVLDNFSTSFVGDAGLGKTTEFRRAVDEADLIMAWNVRLGENTTDGYTLFDVPRIGKPLVHAHPDPQELGRVYQADLPICTGPNALAATLAGLARRGELRGDWGDFTRRHYAAYCDSLALPARDDIAGVDMGQVVAWLQENLPENVIIGSGAGNFGIWHNKFFRYGPQARLLAPQAGAMGYGLPAAIAARLECPDRMVLCIAGDGDFQMSASELGTAMQHGCAPIILVVNNASYGTIRMHQEKHYPGRVTYTDIENPDFQALARAYRLHPERVTRTGDFAGAFRRATASGSGALIELVTDVEAIAPRARLSAIRAAAQDQ